MKEIIGLSGRKKSGKDTLAHYLRDFYDYKIYHFADPLKEFARDYLGLEEKLLWGTDEDKNTLTRYKFKDLYNIATTLLNPKQRFSVGIELFEYCPEDLDKSMTYREILQYFGTEVFRSFDKNIWINTTLRRIKNDNCDKAVIADVRFLDEVHSIISERGEIIRLTRRMLLKDGEKEHCSESALDGYSFFNTIDNQNLTLEDTVKKLDETLGKIALEKYRG